MARRSRKIKDLYSDLNILGDFVKKKLTKYNLANWLWIAFCIFVNKSDFYPKGLRAVAYLCICACLTPHSHSSLLAALVIAWKSVGEMSVVRFSCLSRARVLGCFLPNCASMSSCSDERRRVVVTGMGLVTCLGVGVEHVWQRLLMGDCGITRLTDKGYLYLLCINAHCVSTWIYLQKI